jgi:uncharacterized protein
MGRILFFVLLAAVVLWWLFGRKPRPPVEGKGTQRPARGVAVDDMVACAHCGVHLPRADAVVDGDDLYCGEDHRRLGRRAS